MKFPELKTFKFNAETIKKAKEFENSELPKWNVDCFTGTLIPIFCKNNYYSQYTLSSSAIEDISPIVRLKAKKIKFLNSSVEQIPYDCFNNF